MQIAKSIFDELIHDIGKFTVYRTARKLISLREALKTEHIPYKLFLSVLDIYHLSSPVIDQQEINREKLENIIHDTFFAAEKQGHCKNSFDQQNVEVTTRSVTEYLLGIFNSCTSSKTKVERTIRLYDLKQALLILCKVPNQADLVYEHFVLNCDHNRCVTRFRLKEMLAKLSQILIHIDSDVDMDAWHISNVIDEWFAKCPGIVGLNQYQFTSFWIESKSVFRNYAQLMAISQRIMDTKDIVHHAECAICKTTIKGLRFECTTCSSYSLCFQCFGIDTNTEYHGMSHRLGDSHLFIKCRLFFMKFWSVFGCRHDNPMRITQSLGMATIKTNFDDFRHERTTITNQNIVAPETNLSRRDSNQIDCRLSSIIGLIFSENDKLTSHLNDLEKHGNTESSKNFIKSHLESLKIIIRSLEEYSTRCNLSPTSSTPYRNTSVIRKTPIQSDAFLSKSLKGIDINKSFVDQNNSNLSISDVSSWLHTKRLSSITRNKKDNLPTLNEDPTKIDTDMQNFKELLHIVKDIIDDTYSDNTELSIATNQLEKVLGNIIEGEEKKRRIH